MGSSSNTNSFIVNELAGLSAEDSKSRSYLLALQTDKSPERKLRNKRGVTRVTINESISENVAWNEEEMESEEG